MISDTTRLCPHDFGAYWRLLCDYYQNGPLPDDDDDLRRITGVDKPDWARTKGKVMIFFELNGDGKWHQKRADEVIQERKERSKAIQDGSKKGVKRRREMGQLPPDEPGDDPGVGPRDQSGDDPHDEPVDEPLENITKAKTKTKTKTKPIATAIANSFEAHSLERKDWGGQTLSQKMVDILGAQEIAKRPDWLTRADRNPSRIEAIMDAMHSDIAIGHIIKNRGAYAEHLWKVAK